MIVFCGGMIRSGSTLQFQIASDLLETRGACERWPYLEPEQLELRLSKSDGGNLRGVIKTHVLTSSALALLQQKQAKAVYCYRDLRDVAVSAMRVFGHDWAAMKALQVLQRAITQELLWRAQPEVLVQRYEQFITNLPAAVAEIADHLDVKLQPGEAERIAANYTLDMQRKKIATWEATSAPGQTYHPRELLHSKHIERGEIGCWRHTLDPAIADEITTKYSDWLSAHGYSHISLPEETETNEELCYVPHCGWMAYERGDAVLTGLREGDFEFAEQAFFHRVLRPGDFIIDCGAHSGLYTKLCAPLVIPGGCVHAIEPAPRSFARLERNTADLPSGSCKLHRLALGERNAEINFVVSGEGLSAYNHVAGPTEAKGAINVSQLTLPEFFKQNGLSKIDFIKIDVEGQECAILKAASPLLDKGAIQALMIEFNHENLARYGESCNDLVALLTAHDYKFFALDRSQFRLIAANPSDQKGYANFFAVRNVEWLQRRFADASPLARKIAGETVQRGAQVSAHKRRLLGNIAEQDAYVATLTTERDRLTAEATVAQTEAKRAAREGQKHLEELLAQINKLSTTSHQQAKYIAILEKERDRLSADAKVAQSDAKRAAKDAQRHIDELLAQIKELSATSHQQDEYIAILEKERDRLTTVTATQAKESEHYLNTINEQTDYIKILEAQRALTERK